MRKFKNLKFQSLFGTYYKLIYLISDISRDLLGPKYSNLASAACMLAGNLAWFILAWFSFAVPDWRHISFFLGSFSLIQEYA